MSNYFSDYTNLVLLTPMKYLHNNATARIYHIWSTILCWSTIYARHAHTHTQNAYSKITVTQHSTKQQQITEFSVDFYLIFCVKSLQPFHLNSANQETIEKDMDYLTNGKSSNILSINYTCSDVPT